MKNSIVISFLLLAGFILSTSLFADFLTEKWVVRYNGLGNKGDGARAIAVDSFGNVYVTGVSVGSGTDRDYATIKYDTNGNVVWVARYNGPGNWSDVANDIAVDSLGNVYVTGWSVGNTGIEYATVKYDTNGNEVWVARYYEPGNPPGFSSHIAQAITVDNSGNVYVTGRSRGSVTSFDYATVKYDMNGIECWVARYNGPGNSIDDAHAIAVDSSGNVYVTGESRGSGMDYDYATIAYDSSGFQRWVARHNGPENRNDWSEAIAVDSGGNVYVTGTCSFAGFDTIAYDSSGSELWLQRYDSFGNARDIAVDSGGNVYVTAWSYGVGTRADYATIAYDSSGFQRWVARYNGQGNLNDRSEAIAVDSEGNVYVTGRSLGSSSGWDYATVAYDTNGNECWVARYNGPGNSIDYAQAIAVDSFGNVYVTGESIGSGTQYDYATIKYIPPLSVTIDIKPGSYPNSINLGSNGNVPVAIFSTEDFDATTVDPLTVTLAGAKVKIKGKGDPQANIEDVDGDGLMDIVVHVDTRTFTLSTTDTDAILWGETFDGKKIRGVDTIRIVQE